MEGLASIALAVDFLEKREEKLKQAKESMALNSTAPASAPVPQATSFANAPRRVSSDSVCNETNNAAAPRSVVAPPTAAAASAPAGVAPVHRLSGPQLLAPNAPLMDPSRAVACEDLSPEAVSRMVEELAHDGEFEGRTPPAPPAPTDEIARVLDCDVLCGRGGETNHHSGNVKYRSLVKKYQPLYIMSKRRDKPLIASKIVRLVRHAGGRFLRKDKSNVWRDVGNTKAREKTSQALREGAPDLRGSPQKPAAAAAGKEEMASSPPPPPAHQGQKPYQVLGVREHPGYAAGLPHYAAAPPIGRPGDAPRGFYGPPPPAKKMRFGALPLQSTGGMPHSYSRGGPQQQYHANYAMQQQQQGVGVPAGPSSKSVAVPAKPTSTPAGPTAVVGPAPVTAAAAKTSSCAATVSVDDDDSKGSKDASADGQKAVRGPRLKLLKKRLLDQQTDN